jgi:hypothetical protein
VATLVTSAWTFVISPLSLSYYTKYRVSSFLEVLALVFWDVVLGFAWPCYQQRQTQSWKDSWSSRGAYDYPCGDDGYSENKIVAMKTLMEKSVKHFPCFYYDCYLYYVIVANPFYGFSLTTVALVLLAPSCSVTSKTPLEDDGIAY